MKNIKLFLMAAADAFMGTVGVREQDEATIALEATVEGGEPMAPDYGVSDLELGYEVPVLPMKTPMVLQQFMEQHQTLVCDYVMDCIAMAIKNDYEHVVLFRLGESNCLAVFTYDQYGDQLEILLNHYLSTENYAKAKIATKLLNKYCVERVIIESTMITAV